VIIEVRSKGQLYHKNKKYHEYQQGEAETKGHCKKTYLGLEGCPTLGGLNGTASIL